MRIHFALAGLNVLLVSAAVLGQQPLATLQYRIAGTQLQVSPAAVSVPKGIAGSVLVQLTNGDGTTNNVDAALQNGAYVEAILRGPAFPARRLVGKVGEALLLPPIGLTGDYQLDSIRLVDSATGATRLEASPSSVPVHVFDQVLVSTVSSRPLTMQEITDKGIVIDANNFRAVEFEVAFVLDGQTISVKLPVVSPDFRQSTELIPNDELQKRLVEAQQANDQLAQQLVEGGGLPPELQRPGLNIQIKGANFQFAGDDDGSNLKLSIPPIPALMVIPGNIGYLNQFFSVQIFTENGAPLGSGLSVKNLMAQLNLPPGPDGILSTNYSVPGDDPLRFARVGPNAQITNTLPILGPAPDRVGRFNPGESGSAEFLVEGLQEGLQIMNLSLTADLDGLAAGTVKIVGQAAGSVLVRNPKFSLSFSHPKTIRSGEPYTAYVTVLNTGGSDANLVSVTLRGASISGGLLQSPEVVQLGTLAAGQSATAAFRVLAQRTGSVKFSNLTTGDNSVQGRFNLSIGVDERGVELSPDSIAMPDFVNYLPPTVVEAANRILGQALSAATAPLLPAGVKPVSRATITQHLLELAEAGQRIKYLEATNRVLADLILDWQGGRLVRSSPSTGASSDPTVNPAISAVVPDEGFDQILRVTDAGRQFRVAALQAAEAADTANDTARLIARAPDLAGRSEPWLLAGSSDPNLTVGALSPAGNVTTDRSDLPGATAYPGSRGSWLVAHALTPVVNWTASSNITSADLSVVILGTNGAGTQWRWSVTGVAAGTCFSFDPSAPANGLLRDDHCDGTLDGTLAASVQPVQELPPQVLTVLQDTDVRLSRPFSRCTAGPANNYGQVLGILFSKPILQTNAAIPAAYRLDNGNSASGVQVQSGGRIALVSMKEGVSAIRPRVLTVTGVTDQRGNATVPAPVPVQSQFHDGVAVNGRVLRADGTPAAGVPVTVTMYDPWKDPFDRCDPIVISRTSQKYTDAAGLFTFDFVHAGVSFTIAAVDTGGLTVEAIQTILNSSIGDRFAAEKLAALAAATNALATLGVQSLIDATRMVEGLDRAVWSDNIDYGGGRMGHEIVVGLRFRGRAVVTGTVLAPDGISPVPNAAVNLFPDPDSRELGRGVFTDSNGRFEFNGVPLGQFTVDVKTSQGHFRTVAGALDRVGTTNDLQITLTAPVPQEIVRTSISGRVVEPDNVTGHAQAQVFVNSLGHGVVGAVTADNSGYWQLNDIPAGAVTVTAYSLDRRRRGFGVGTAVTNSTAFILTPLTGTGRVVGRVETSSGLPVANAIVAGGEALARTDTNGAFVLTGVPQGAAKISAGLEAQYAPGGFPRIGSATVNVLPEIDNYAVIRLPAVGQVIGRVTDANGNPVTGDGKNVAIPLPAEQGFAWVKIGDDGRFQFPNIAVGDYVVSAPAPPVDQDAETILDQGSTGTDDQIAAALQDAVTAVNQVIARRLGDGPAVTPGSFGWTRVSVRFDGDTAIANIQYLPEGKVNGTVLNDQGVPIGAAVRLTGPGLDGIGLPTTLVLGNGSSDPASGVFSFARLPQGTWALQGASPFYPVVTMTNGATTRFDLDVTNAVLQFPPLRDFNGRLTGSVLMPDGSPAGAGVNVRISFSSDYSIRTDTTGLFDTQIKIPAGTYKVEAADPATGLKGEALAAVQAGVTNSTTVKLLGKGALRLLVLQANGTPAVNASVRVTQSTYPQDQYNGTTDTNGTFFLGNVFEGKYGLNAVFLTGATRLEGNVGRDVTLGATNLATIVLGPTGTIRGVFVNRDDGSPISAARVSIGNAAFPSTGVDGGFQASGLALGTYRIVAREAVSGRLAVAYASLTYDGQIVDVRLTQLPLGELRGTVFQSREAGPIAGVTVKLSRPDGLTPDLTVTTGPDGVYSFPAVAPGQFTLLAQKSYGPAESYNRLVSGNYPDNTTTLTVDLTLPPRTVYGSVIVQVFEPDGQTPATHATVNKLSTDASGKVAFENLAMGTQTFYAQSIQTNQTSSGGVGTVVLTESLTNITLTIALSGVGRIHGRVLQSDGMTPAVGAEVTGSAWRRDLNLFRQATTITVANGEFALEDFPIAPFQIAVIDGALAGSNSGVITNAGQTAEVVLRLGASGSLTGRLLRADGSTVVDGNPVELTFKAPSGLDGISTAITDSQGHFRFDSIPVGKVDFTAAKIEVNGLAKVHTALTANSQVVDLGDVLLHEDWPFVVSVTPGTGAQGVSTTSQIEMIFSEPIATNSIVPTGIYLRGPSNNVPATLSWDPPTNSSGGTWVVRLTPKAPLPSRVTYRLFVLAGAVEDGFGTVIGQGPLSLVDRPLLAPFSSSFITRDDEPPVLVSLFPTNGAVQIDSLAVMRLSFNEPIASTNLLVTLTGPAGAVPGATALGFNGTVLTFSPSQPLAVNATYTLRVQGVRDLSGNLMSGLPIVATFSMLDTLGPTVATLHLAADQKPVAGGKVLLEALLATNEPGVSVRFSANLDALGQVTNSPFQLPTTLPVAGSITYRAIATDHYGNDGPVAEFTVSVVADRPPVVTLVRELPSNGPVPSGSNFVVSVSATGDLPVTNLAVNISGPTNVQLNFLDGNSRSLPFTLPASAIAGGTVQVSARATDSLGLASAEASVFWTVSDGTPPGVAILSPGTNAVLEPNAPLDLVVSMSDNSTNVSLQLVLSGGISLTQTLAVPLVPNVTTNRTFSLSLAGVPKTGASITAAVTATDADTNVTRLTRTFLVADRTPPQITTVTPPNGALRQSLWLNGPAFQFSEAMSPATLSTNDLLFTNIAGLTPSYRVVLESGNTVARLSPTVPLQPGATYTARVLPGPTDLAGNRLAGVNGAPLPAAGTNFTFTTAAIIGVSPTNGTHVVAGQNVDIGVDFEPGLGAGYFRFVLNGGLPFDVAVPGNASNVFARLAVPADATHGDISILASDTAAFQSPYQVTNLSLKLLPASFVQVSLSVPPQLTLLEGQSSNVVISAFSDGLPLAGVGFSSTNPAPSFASLSALQLINSPTNGSATAQLILNPVYGDAGTYQLTLLATATNGAFKSTNIFLTVAANSSFVATHWKDPVDGLWNDTNRWTDGLPGINRPAAIDLPGTYTVTLSVDAAVAGLVIGGSTGIQTLAINGRTLTLNTSSVIRSNGVVSLNAGGIAGNAPLTVAGSLNWTGGTLAGTNAVDLLPAATLTISGGNDKITTRVLNNHGAVRWNGGRIFANGAVINNQPGSLFEIQCDQQFYDAVFNNSGTVRKVAGTGTTDLRNVYGSTGRFNNNGVLDLESGTLNFYINSTHTAGHIVLATNTTLNFNSGTHTLDLATHLDGEGIVAFTGGNVTLDGPFATEPAVSITSGTVTFNQPALALQSVSLSGGIANFNQTSLTLSNLVLSSGTLGGTASLLVTNSMSWSGGTLLGTNNELTVAKGATLAINGGNDKNLTRTVNNLGTVLWNGGRIFANGAAIYNPLGSLFEVHCDQQFYDAVFNNSGTVRKVAGTGITDLRNVYSSTGRFNNNGLLDLESGTLNFYQASTHTAGHIVLATNTTLNFNSGTHTLDLATHLDGEGIVAFTGGNVTLDGPFATEPAVSITSGTVTFNQPALALQSVSLSGGVANFNQTSLTLSNLVLSSGTLGGTASLLVTNSMSWSGGSLLGTNNELTVAKGATLAINGGNDKNLTRTFNNLGTVLWNEGRIFANGALINNLAGSLFEVHCDQQCYDAVFNNSGTVRKVAGTGTTELRNVYGTTGRFNNNGLLDLQSGTMSVYCGGTSSGGSFDLGTNTFLLLTSGTQTFTNGCAFSGTGMVRIQTPLVLGQDVDFGRLSVAFESFGSVAGAFKISNSPAGTILLTQSLTLPGSLDIGGALQITNTTVLLQVAGTLTLESSGELLNSGTIKVGAFVNNGGTIVGNAPVVSLVVPMLIEVVRVPGSQTGGPQPRASVETQDSYLLRWVAPSGQTFILESSTDLVHWTPRTTTVRHVAADRYEANLAQVKEKEFFRLRAR